MDIQKPNQNFYSDSELEHKQGANSQNSSQSKNTGGGVLNFFVEIVKIVFLALIIIVPIRVFIFQPFVVKGASMEPNFHNGEYLIVNELGYKRTEVAIGEKKFFTVDSFKDLQRGDPVVFRYPKNPKEYFIKRIVGLPGEKIFIKNGLVRIVNEETPEGFLLDESEYLPTFVETEGNKEYFLGNDDYFVLGDNRGHSSDSRTWGILPGNMIMGKVLLRALPIGDFKFF